MMYLIQYSGGSFSRSLLDRNDNDYNDEYNALCEGKSWMKPIIAVWKIKEKDSFYPFDREYILSKIEEYSNKGNDPFYKIPDLHFEA